MTCQVRDTVAQWMPESASEAIQAPILRHFPALVRDLGGDPAAILGAFDLATEACDKEGAVTCRQWVGVLEFAATVLQAEDIGMRLAERQGGVGCFGPLGRVMRNCRNFGDSLNYAATHNAAHSLAVRVWMGRTTSGQSVFMGHELLGEDLSNRMQAIEHALLAGHLAARATTGGRVGARRVHFRHQALAARSVYRRHFQCEVRFCCNEDGLAFAAADMQAPICGPDDVSLPDMIEEIERTYGDRHPPFHAQVRGVVMPLLWTGSCAVEDVARVLELHPRALHRRLQEEQCNFQSIKDEVRRDILVFYLKRTSLSFGRISEKLGFSEQSAMSRFARQQLNASPRELRRSH